MIRSMLHFAAAALAAALVSGAHAALAQDAAPAAGETAAAEAPEAAAPSARDGAAVTLQLNKLEDADDVCRAYFIVDNALDEPLALLQVDTFLFDPDGVISQRAALTFQNIRAGREKVAIFDFALACAGIGRLLINEVLSCEAPSGPSEACLGALGTSSRAGAPLDY